MTRAGGSGDHAGPAGPAGKAPRGRGIAGAARAAQRAVEVPMPGHTWHQPDEALFRSTEHGVAKAAGLKDDRSAMPAGERVPGDEAIVAALSWIRAPWPADVRSRHGAVNRQGPR